VHATTVLTPIAPGTVGIVPGGTGELDPFLARGAVLATGQAGNLHDSRVVHDLIRAAKAFAG
jgi:hypothetical protein